MKTNTIILCGGGIYSAPSVERVDISVEAGFAQSPFDGSLDDIPGLDFEDAVTPFADFGEMSGLGEINMFEF